MKKILSLVLSLIMVLGTSMPAFAVTGTDSQAGKDLKSYGIIVGTEKGLDETTVLTRAMMATILVDLYGKKAEAATYAIPSSFTDVPKGKWFSKYIAFAEKEGWMIGDGKGLTFRPNDTMTAQEVNATYLKGLGYDVKWEEVNAKATELKMAVNPKDTEKVLRGEAFSAMRAALDVYKMGTTETLGTTLVLTGYVVPEQVSEPMTEKLEVLKVIIENEKTVVIEFDQELSKESVNTTNFKVTGLTISKVFLSKNKKNVTLNMSSYIAQSEEIEIVIKDVKTADEGLTLADYNEKFVFTDVIVPVIESVSVLDNKYIIVHASEPMRFSYDSYTVLPGIKINGNPVSAKVVADDKNFIYTIKFEYNPNEGYNTITLEGLEDYSNLVAAKTEFNFNIPKKKKDPILPIATAKYEDDNNDGEIDRIVVTATDGNITDAVQGDFTLAGETAGDDLTITGIGVLNNVITLTVTGQTDVTLTDDTLAWYKGAFRINGTNVASRTATTMVDSAKPQVKSITAASSNDVNTLAKENETVTFTVNFTESVTVSGVTATTFTNAVGTITADLDASSAASGTISVTVNAGDNGAIDVNSAAFTITDANSNVQTYVDRASVNTHATIPTTVTADTIAPAATLDITTDVNGVLVNKAANNITITAVGKFEVGLVVDVTKITIDTEDDDAITPNVTLAVADVLSVSSNGNSVMIQLNGDGAFNVDAVLAAFTVTGADSIDFVTGWLKDAAGNEIPVNGVGTIPKAWIVLN